MPATSPWTSRSIAFVLGVAAVLSWVAYNMLASSSIAATGLALSSVLVVSVQAVTNSTPQALNPLLTNSTPNAPGGPILYYNGSGPVPPYDELSPIPSPITPLNR